MHIRKPAVYVSVRAPYVFPSRRPLCTLPRRPMRPLLVFMCASPPPLFLARQGPDPSIEHPSCTARMMQPLCALSPCHWIESVSFALGCARICKARTFSEPHECRGC